MTANHDAGGAGAPEPGAAPAPPDDAAGAASARHAPADQGGPPPPPDMRRRVRLYRSQWVGLPLLLLLPVLAVVGVLGEGRTTTVVSDDVVQVTIDHPTRMRARQRTTIRIDVEKRAGAPHDSLLITFDAAWLAGLRDVVVTPEPERAWTVIVTDLAPGETAAVRVELESERVWRTEGRVRVAHAGGAGYDVALNTFVFP